jgi:N-ethylmaleimide reductase
VSAGHLNGEAVDNVDGATSTVGSTKMRLIPLTFLKSFRKRYRGPVIMCGALTSKLAETMLADGVADLFAFGTAFIANPDLPKRLKETLPLFDLGTSCFYDGDERGYSDYPANYQ